jgi:hypothetical protein
MKFYDASSYSAMRVWLGEADGQLISDRQIGYVTDRTAFADRFYRQRITETDNRTLIIENALHGSGNVLFKIYWTALVISPAGIMITALDRRRDGHHVLHVDSTPWLTTASLSPY